MAKATRRSRTRGRPVSKSVRRSQNRGRPASKSRSTSRSRGRSRGRSNNKKRRSKKVRGGAGAGKELFDAVTENHRKQNVYTEDTILNELFNGQNIKTIDPAPSIKKSSVNKLYKRKAVPYHDETNNRIIVQLFFTTESPIRQTGGHPLLIFYYTKTNTNTDSNVWNIKGYMFYFDPWELYTPKLPEGWEARTDPNTMRQYYVNPSERKTQWDPPPPRAPGLQCGNVHITRFSSAFKRDK